MKTDVVSIPLSKLNCHHCKIWHKDCQGITYKNLDKTGDTYCVHIWREFSEESVDGQESNWLVTSQESLT